MLMRKTGVALAILFVTMQSFAESKEKQPNRGLLMWSAFSCATFAELSGNESEQKRLFNVGYKTGTQLLSDIQRKKLKEAEFKELPIGVQLRLSGPTTEFTIGRIFEGATEDAFDKVVKEDGNGQILIDPSKWADGELRVSRAKKKFQESNCGLLR
ncbi:MAG: hypothetical protein LHV69_11335 [Elusimicrobia bacterium]|nr:hypothetical protein [Candidatus Obscuribacterium magneticum]